MNRNYSILWYFPSLHARNTWVAYNYQNSICFSCPRKRFCQMNDFIRCFILKLDLRISINGLVTYKNTKLCCRAFILTLFYSTTANKIDS